MEKMGDFARYNDYELLYLVRENVDEAKEILIWKYSFLIKSRIHKCGVPYLYWDDFYQEGLIMLYKAIRVYDDNSKMTFTNFFDLLLKRRLITLYRKVQKDMICDKIEDVDELLLVCEKKEKIYSVDEMSLDLSKLEKVVYDKIFVDGYKIEALAKELGIKSKSISNAKQRVVKKIRNKYNKCNQEF